MPTIAQPLTVGAAESASSPAVQGVNAPNPGNTPIATDAASSWQGGGNGTPGSNTGNTIPRVPIGNATPISADSIGTTSTPINTSLSSSSTPTTSPAVAPPGGTTVQKDGTVVPTPAPTTAPADSQTSSIGDAMKGLIGELGTEGDVTTSLNDENQIDTKTNETSQSYNTYISAKNAYDQALNGIYANTSGMTADAVSEATANLQRTMGNTVSNLQAAYQAQQGDLDAAQKTITDKITAQFQPIKDEISALEALNTTENDNMSKSDQIAAQTAADNLKTNMTQVATASTTAQGILVKANAPTSAIASIDSIVENFKSGNITSDQAESQMNEVAAKFDTSGDSTQKVTNADGSTSLIRLDGNGNIVSTMNVGGGTNAGLSVGGGTLPTVSMTAAGVPDTTAQSTFLKNLPPDVATLVKGITNYTINPNAIPTRQYKGASGMTQASMLALASQYDPTYDENQYAARQALQTNFSSGQYSQNINSLNTAVGHLSDIPGNFSKLGNVGMTSINTIKNSLMKSFGSGSVTGASTNIQAAVGELASVFKSGGATDSEIANLGTIDSNSSPAQMKAFVQTGINLLSSRLQALQQTYQSGMGKPPAQDFLSPQNAQVLSGLKNQGYQVDVPGVYYTDPKAYIQYGGGSQDTLTKAYTALKNLNDPQNPPTAQNVLQYAQLINQ